ncbi:hypothetical protein CsatB_016337 [Cannabis sativa]
MADLAYTLAPNVLDRLGSIAYNKISLAHGMKDDLEKLKLITLSLKIYSTMQWMYWMNLSANYKGETLSNRKVRRFFSYSNPLAYRFSVAHRIKEIRKKLDEVDKNMRQFQLIKTPLNVEESFRETHSFVNLSDVIGRDREKREFVDIVLKDKTQESIGRVVIGEESRIIVTTRNNVVASIMGETNTYELKGLLEKDCFSLFFRYAFGSEATAAEYPQLKQIGEEIVRKCGGVPLALKTLCSLLRLKK